MLNPMNQHLNPVFNILLPSLEKEGVDCWVFGGVGVAAYAGEFIRPNGDVDTFVKEIDFNKARAVLNKVCESNSYRLIPHIPAVGRPKLDIKINGKERFSVMPIYVKDNAVDFKFGDVTDHYPLEILDKVERNIDGNKFFTPSNKYIKQIFINHLKDRTDKISRPKIRTDINAVFTLEEQRQYGFT